MPLDGGRRTLGALAVDAESVDAHARRYSFCTLVTDFDQYESMVRSFRAAGFGDEVAEYLYVDNAQTSRFDAFAGLNFMAARARGEYLVLCHQDLLARDDERKLAACLDDLSQRDPAWAVAGNAGCTHDAKLRARITDRFGIDRTQGPLPARVAAIDENLMIVRREALVGLSRDLSGFHMVGADLVTQAELAGWTAYVIDFHLEHLGMGGSGASFVACQKAFEEKYVRALRPRPLRTTVTRSFVGKPSLWTRAVAWRKKRQQLADPGQTGKTKLATRLKIALHELMRGPVYTLDGHRFTVPKTTPFAAKRALHKGNYELPERQLIRKYLPENLPVVELGGSFGVVSRVIRDRIGENSQLVVVEANPDLLPICRRNSGIEESNGTAALMNAAVSYSGDDTVSFMVTEGIHDSRLGQNGAAQTPGKKITVKAMTLSEILRENGIDGPYGLVCDIEGAEYELFAHDAEALSRCQCAIVETHPMFFAEEAKSAQTFMRNVSEAGFQVVEQQLNVMAAVRP